ncbi:MAG TPA: hypothetical protein VIH93_15740 [Thermoanaerobaculia bacterium]
MSENDLPTLREYLRANAGRYTPEALRANLLAEGYDAETVDRALAESAGAPKPPPGPRQVAFRRGWLIALGNLVLTFVAVVVLAWPIEIIAGIVLVTGRRRLDIERAEWGAALLFGALVYFAVALLVFGSCLGGLGLVSASPTQVPLVVAGIGALLLVVGGLIALARWTVRTVVETGTAEAAAPPPPPPSDAP